MSQQRGHFQGNPSVHTVGPIVNRAEKIGRAGQVFQCDFKEQGLTGFAFSDLLANGWVVRGAVLDGVLENRGIRGKSRYREFTDVTLKRTAVEEIARDVVEPETLTKPMKLSGGFNSRSSRRLGTGQDELFNSVRESFLRKRCRHEV